MDASAIAGLWSLDSIRFEDQETQELTDMYGPSPRGHILITGDGHMMVLITRSDSVMPANAADESALFKSMMAYAGRYRVEGGNQIVIAVTEAWHPAWVNTEQTRFFAMKDGALVLSSPWQTHPNFPGRTGRGVVVWHRAGSG